MASSTPIIPCSIIPRDGKFHPVAFIWRNGVLVIWIDGKRLEFS